MNSSYSFTYTTIHYQCGHSVIRRVLRHQAGATERWSYLRCEPCTDQLERRYAVVREVEQEREEEVRA